LDAAASFAGNNGRDVSRGSLEDDDWHSAGPVKAQLGGGCSEAAGAVASSARTALTVNPTGAKAHMKATADFKRRFI
jgi:hypothetical protein